MHLNQNSKVVLGQVKDKGKKYQGKEAQQVRQKKADPKLSCASVILGSENTVDNGGPQDPNHESMLMGSVFTPRKACGCVLTQDQVTKSIFYESILYHYTPYGEEVRRTWKRRN